MVTLEFDGVDLIKELRALADKYELELRLSNANALMDLTPEEILKINLDIVT